MHPGTLDDLSTAFGGDAQLAVAAAVGRTAVANWRKRGGVPPSRWAAIVAGAAERGLSGITFEYMAGLQRPSQRVNPTSGKGACHDSGATRRMAA